MRRKVLTLILCALLTVCVFAIVCMMNGIGEKKFGKTNKVEVPLFSGNIEDWDDYLKSYGKECLFYSLTGYDLYCGDCCMSKSVDEFVGTVVTNAKNLVPRIKAVVNGIKKLINSLITDV